MANPTNKRRASFNISDFLEEEVLNDPPPGMITEPDPRETKSSVLTDDEMPVKHSHLKRLSRLTHKGPTLLPQVVWDLKRELEKGNWAPSKEEKKNTHIEGCNPIILDNLKYLASEYGKNQSRIARAAMNIGINLLWTIEGIKEIGKIAAFVHKHSDDQEDREFFSSAKFDGLTSVYAKPLHIEFFENDVKQCDGLASRLGLSPGIIRQLAMMAGLIHADAIPKGDRDRMVGILKAFRQWVKRRLERAERIKKVLEEKQRDFPQQPTERSTSWRDVIEDK
jgi:hypothetical protein